MQRVLVLCLTIVSFSAARGADIREQVRIDGVVNVEQVHVDSVFVLEIGLTSRSAAFSPDGKLLVTASTGGRAAIFGGGGTHFWDPVTGKHLATLDDDDGKRIGALAFTPDGKTLAGGTGCEVCLWDVRTRKLTGRLKGSRYVSLMTFSADGTMLATSGSAEGDVQIWGVKEKVVATLKAKAQDVRALAFSGDGKSLAVGYADGTIRLWDVKTGRQTAGLPGHTKRVLALAFEPGDQTVLSAGLDKMVRRWDLTTGKATATTRLKDAAEPYGLAFGPDLATLATADEGGLTIWDTRTGARVSNFQAKLHPPVLAFSPDGKWLAAEPGMDDGKIGSRSIQVWVVDKPMDK